jgi:UDPglucose 6-dehydrogenase
VCDVVGADVGSIADAIGKDPRIGPAFLRAGIGYGGSCFPKDTRALRHLSGTNGYDFRLLSAVIEVNNAQRLKVVEKLGNEWGVLDGKTVAVLGLAFKPGTDDMRDSPSLPIIEALLGEGVTVRAHDPLVAARAAHVLPDRVLCTDSVDEALAGADAAVLATDWPEYSKLTPERLSRLMTRPLLVDGRNAYPPIFRGYVDYRGIGWGLITGRKEGGVVTYASTFA